MGWRCGWVGTCAALLLACGGSSQESRCADGAAYDPYAGACYCEPGYWGDPEQGCEPHAEVCAEAQDRVGHSVCVHTLDDQEQWNRLSLGGGPASAGTRRYGKYLVPHSPESRLPTMFADANYYRLHYCLMARAFAPQFPGLTMEDQTDLIFAREHREFFGGATYEFEPGGATAFGFTVETRTHPDEQLALDEVYEVYRALQDRFGAGELAYVPVGDEQIESAAQWDDPPFVVADARDDSVTFETYTPGIAYGRVRIVGNEQDVVLGWQDIAVFDDVPIAQEGVFAAAVTGTRQDILSHLNVLSGQRGSPNLFVDDAVTLFQPYEGQLVRLQTDAIRYMLTPASEQEAADYWESNRPRAEVEHPASYDYEGLDAFTAIATDTREARDQARGIFGAKTVGLATLWSLLAPSRLTPGFGVPFHAYGQFMQDNTWQVDFGAGPITATYGETIAQWLEDPSFVTDAAVRKQRLTALRDEMIDNGVVPAALVTALQEKIVEVFGSDTVMVRFRSSSNAEDSLAFNGAGLYESRSACAADSGAAAGAATSACDPNKGPRSIEEALILVWSSLWSFGAFDERDYYQMDHSLVAMGVTVSLRYEDELANGVAFTGNPGDPNDDSYLVNAQYGDTDVVAPTPGQTAELTYLTVKDGEVREIERVIASSLVPAGTPVVTDAQLFELGGVMAELDAIYPRDVEAGADKPLLDMEFKITGDGSVVLKQIRLFPQPEYADGPLCRD